MLTNRKIRERRAGFRKKAIARSERARATTDRTCELLEDIRNMAQDALDFIPGHTMKPEFRKLSVEHLTVLRDSLRALDFTGEWPC